MALGLLWFPVSIRNGLYQHSTRNLWTEILQFPLFPFRDKTIFFKKKVILFSTKITS